MAKRVFQVKKDSRFMQPQVVRGSEDASRTQSGQFCDWNNHGREDLVVIRLTAVMATGWKCLSTCRW